jgi:hypothetical protein
MDTPRQDAKGPIRPHIGYTKPANMCKSTPILEFGAGGQQNLRLDRWC